MKAIKVLLVVFGVLIVAGFVFVGREIYLRATDPERAMRPSAPARVEPGAVVGLGLPSDARIGEIVPVGNRVAFRVSVPGAGDRLYVVDPRSGAVEAAVATDAPAGGAPAP